MSSAYLAAVAGRRSVYGMTAIGKDLPIPESRVVEIVEAAIKDSPTSFNSQSSRALVLFNDDHTLFWTFVKRAIQAIVPPESWAASEARLNGFQGGAGTVLFFEDSEAVEGLQKNIPLYAERFPQWSEHASGMLQLVVWTALSEEGVEHYNPLINDDVVKQWGVPESWVITSQLVFGEKKGEPKEKTYKPVEERLKVAGLKA
ncbi:Nitroreductase [Pseudohyphozyma bogoriensis]|nr:Nitroreductase [Pseudohyphozyma bogoriensis]